MSKHKMSRDCGRLELPRGRALTAYDVKFTQDFV